MEPLSVFGGVVPASMQGTAIMDRNNRIGRRELREILKSTQGLGKGVVAVDKGQLDPLRPSTILRALEESIARRFREHRIRSASCPLYPGKRTSFGIAAMSALCQ